MNLRIGRTIFALLVALSVATLPAAAGFAAGGKSMDVVTASGMTPDCDHHQAPSDKTHKTMDDGACMAACAVGCFNVTATGLSDFSFSSPVSTALKPVLADPHVASRMGSPPFRPPRS